MSSDDDQLFSDNYEDDEFAPAEEPKGATAKKKSSLSIDMPSKSDPTKKSAKHTTNELDAGFQLPIDDDNGFGNFNMDDNLFKDSGSDRNKNKAHDLGLNNALDKPKEPTLFADKPKDSLHVGSSGLLDFKKPEPAVDGSRRATAQFGHQVPKHPIASKPAEAKKENNRFDYLNFAKDNESESDQIREKESDEYEDDFEASGSRSNPGKSPVPTKDLPRDRGFTLGRADK